MPTLPRAEWLAALTRLAPLSRIKEMLDAAPTTPRYFSPQSIAKVLNDEPPVIALRPEQFHQLASPLPRSAAAPYIDHYARMITRGDWVEPPPGLYMEHYLQQQRARPFEGFNSVPWLKFIRDPQNPEVSQAHGHEGRHRMYVVQDLDPGARIPVQAFNLPPNPITTYSENPRAVPLDLSDVPRFSQGGLS